MHFLIQKLDSQYQTMMQLPADADAANADNTFTRIHDLLIVLSPNTIFNYNATASAFTTQRSKALFHFNN